MKLANSGVKPLKHTCKINLTVNTKVATKKDTKIKESTNILL